MIKVRNFYELKLLVKKPLNKLRIFGLPLKDNERLDKLLIGTD